MGAEDCGRTVGFRIVIVSQSFPIGTPSEKLLNVYDVDFYQFYSCSTNGRDCGRLKVENDQSFL